MSIEALSAGQAAETFLRVIPQGIDAEVLEEYGIPATAEGTRHITRELLLVNLFWIATAIHAVLPAKAETRVNVALQVQILRDWETTFQQPAEEWPRFLDEMVERKSLYHQIVQEGGSPMAVLTEAASLLVKGDVVSGEDRSKLLALLFDHVPVDELGPLAAEMTLLE
jgi:hypothetical protein